MSGAPYSFRSLQENDLTLVDTWLQTSEVRRWWGEPAVELALIREDLYDPRIEMRIVSLEHQPFAYTQDYDVHAWPQPHLSELAPGTRVIDTLIGKPALLGLGHGSRYLRQLALRLMHEGASGVVIDPVAENIAARRSYAKAGFSQEIEVLTRDGPTILMFFDDR